MPASVARPVAHRRDHSARPAPRRGTLGRTHAEALFAVGNSTLNALAQGPEPILIDSTHHALRFAEARARQAVWRRRERELVGDGSGLPIEVPHRTERPAPFPEGPVEKLGDRAALASLLGAGGVLAATRDPGRAGDLMLATMPKAARLGREAFASMLDWELSRHGVVPMDVPSLRRLDRISLVAIDSSVLCETGPESYSAVVDGPGCHRRQVWADRRRSPGRGRGCAAVRRPGPVDRRRVALREAAADAARRRGRRPGRA